MCPRCKGLMVRELFLERITCTTPCYYCVNCGNYTDPIIRKNQAMTSTELANLRRNDAEFPVGFQYSWNA